jgi:hypothetical protein
MPALNFKARFAPDIESGKKQQTIRRKGRRPWRAGDTAYLYTEQRQPGCRLLGIVPVIDVFDITIDFKRRSIILEHEERRHKRIEVLDERHIEMLASADGFSSVDEFFEFFSKTYGGIMVGQLILWFWARGRK